MICRLAHITISLSLLTISSSSLAENHFIYRHYISGLTPEIRIDPDKNNQQSECSEIIKGDWDKNCQVDNDDVIGLLNALRDGEESIDPSFDLNGDGVIDTSDIAAMRHLCTFYACQTEYVSDEEIAEMQEASNDRETTRERPTRNR